MFTQCIECLSIYKIEALQLQAGLGEFRCGHCGHVFNALLTLTDQLPDAAHDELPRAHAESLPPVLNVPVMHQSKQAPLFDDDPTISALPDSSVTPGELSNADSPEWISFSPGLDTGDKQHESDFANSSVAAKLAAIDRQVPSKADRGKPSADIAKVAVLRAKSTPPSKPTPQLSNAATGQSPGKLRWFWILVSLFACFTIVGQIGWLEKARLMQHQDLRGIYEGICKLARCKLPLRANFDQLTLLDRDVAPHPRTRGALLISATVRNDAAFDQAFPMVEVRLLNVTRQLIAARRFLPSEYLQDQTASERGLSPGTTMPIVFEVLDPGNTAVNFEFAFLALTEQTL